MKVKSEKFQPVKDFVYIEADPEKKHYKDLGNGKKIWVDAAFNPHEKENCTQDGIVRYIPIKLSTKKEIKLKAGDRVFCHHFLCDEDNLVEVNGKKLYRLNYEMIYCTLNGKIKMLDGWNFVEPLEKKKPSAIIIAPFQKKETLKGVLKHTNPSLIEKGAKEGDTIFFTRESDYEMIVEGETFYRMNNEDIIAVEE